MPEKCLNGFLEDHSGILTVLGLFMIFLGTASNNIFPKINDVIDFSSGSTFVWLSFMLIVILCLISLINSSWNYGKLSVYLFGSFLIIAFIPVFMYFLFSTALNSYLINSLNLFPKSLSVSFMVMLPLFVIVGINHIKSTALRRSLHFILLSFSIIYLYLLGSVINLSQNLLNLNNLTWLSLAIIISYFFNLYSLVNKSR